MTLKLTFLGTGTSSGVPVIGCDCEVCTSDDPRDRRDRPSVMVEYATSSGEEFRAVIDTGPDLRHQMLRHRVKHLHAVLYTHNHADHVFGLDDLRRFNVTMQQAVPIYAEASVLDWMQQTFRYIFHARHNINASFVADLLPHPVEPDRSFDLGGRVWTPLRLMHGRLPIVGYRVGGLAYCTDCSSVPPETLAALEGLDVLVIDALRYRHHPTHFTVDQALNLIEQVRPRRAYLTHLAHDICHADLEPRLPEGVGLAHDGLQIEITPLPAGTGAAEAMEGA